MAEAKPSVNEMMGDTDFADDFSDSCVIGSDEVRQDFEKVTKKSSVEEKSSLKMMDICVDKCFSHPDRVIEYFCSPCNVLGCSVCIIKGHRRCENVDFIPDIVNNIQHSEEVEEFTKTIFDQSTSLCMQETRYQANKNRSEMLKDSTKQVIKARTQEVYRLIERLQDKMDKRVENIYEKDQQKLSKVLGKINSLKYDLQKISCNFETKRSAGLNCQLFVALKIAKKDTMAIKRNLQELDDQNKVQNYQFELASNIQQLTMQQEELGRLLKTSSETKKRIKFLFSIPINSRNDRYEPEPAGMCLVSENCLIVVDNNNFSVKVLNVNNKTLTSVLTFESKPWDVTKVSNKEVAMTFPDDGKVNFLAVTTDCVLTELKIIDVGWGCRGICYSDEKFYVSYCGNESGYIKVLDMSGKILKDISGHYKPQFQTPFFLDISPDKQSLYVSDAGNFCVICMTLDGKVKAVKNKTGTVYGLTVDVDGSVYVCDFHVDLDIEQLSEDCKLVQTLQLEKGPHRAVVFCKKTNRLFLSIAFTKSEVQIYSSTA